MLDWRAGARLEGRCWYIGEQVLVYWRAGSGTLEGRCWYIGGQVLDWRADWMGGWEADAGTSGSRRQLLRLFTSHSSAGAL